MGKLLRKRAAALRAARCPDLGLRRGRGPDAPGPDRPNRGLLPGPVAQHGQDRGRGPRRGDLRRHLARRSHLGWRFDHGHKRRQQTPRPGLGLPQVDGGA